MNAEATTQQDTSDSTHADLIKDEVRIYFYPKIIFLLPTLVFCLLASVYLQFFGSDQPVAANGTQAVVEAAADDSASEQAETEANSSPRVTVTVAFMLVFTLNLVVMAFDFPSNRFIALMGRRANSSRLLKISLNPMVYALVPITKNYTWPTPVHRITPKPKKKSRFGISLIIPALRTVKFLPAWIWRWRRKMKTV